MRTARRVALYPALAIGSAALWLALSAAPAQACKCMQMPPAQAYEQAVAVFEARVLEIVEPQPGQTGPANQRRVRLQAVRSWKGLESEAVELSTAAESAACGFNFAQGQSYLVYAYADEGKLRVTSCSRTRLMAEAGEDLQTMGMGATPVEPTGPATSGSVAVPAKPAQPPARGGCASCSVGARAVTRDGQLGALLGLIVASGLIVRRRRNR